MDRLALMASYIQACSFYAMDRSYGTGINTRMEFVKPIHPRREITLW